MLSEPEKISGDTPAVSDAPAAGAPAAVDRPADLPENFWDAEAKAPKWTDLAATLKEAADLKAEKEAAAAKPAPKPEDYKVAFSDEAVKTLFNGQAPELDTDAPLVKGLPDWAAKHGVPQEAVSELADMYGAFMVGEAKAGDDLLRAEIEKLGANGPARVSAIRTFIEGNLPQDKGEALLSALGRSSSGALEAMEDLIKKTAGLSSPPQAGAAKAGLDALKPIDRWTAHYEQAVPKIRRRA